MLLCTQVVIGDGCTLQPCSVVLPGTRLLPHSLIPVLSSKMSDTQAAVENDAKNKWLRQRANHLPEAVHVFLQVYIPFSWY